MKPEDVKIGMKVMMENNPLSLYEIISTVKFCYQNYYVDVKKLSNGNVTNGVNVSTLIPAEQPEFTWDKKISTIGKPFTYKDKWYIQVDGSKSALFEQPKTFYSIIDGNTPKYNVYAIIPQSDLRYILKDTRVSYDMFLPVTHTPRVQEMTVEEIEEKLGHKIKIVAKV